MQADIRSDIAWAQVNADVLHSMEAPRRIYWVLVGTCIALIVVAIVAYSFQFRLGLGVAGLNRPQMWGPYIANFIFWVGVSHAGTLLSAALLITRTEWRRPVYRSAEAMTTCALLTAGLFPILHLGRVWDVHWTFPFPNERELWPNFRSPLLWDLTAIFTYLNCSMLFLYYGMIPDLAIYRDKARGWRKKLYSALSLGWSGTDRQWRNFRIGYLTLACFLLPLAISVHSVVSADFAMSNVAGWHVTSFPPYFVAGALYSGCAGIITLFILLRHTFRFEEYLTPPILDKLCWITFAIAMVWSYLNLIEFATTFYGHDRFEMDALVERATGVYAPYWWFMIVGGIGLPFLLLSQRIRRNMAALMALSLLMNLIMWIERWMILAPSLLRNHAPYGWGLKWPSVVEMLITLGAFAWFTLLFLAFVKIFPSVSMYEIKEMLFEHREVSDRLVRETAPQQAPPGAAHDQTA
jgi:molybdopterin-containing oxidoreductase family membrane subunit